MKIIANIALVLLLTSCSIFNSLTSNTTIKPNDSFLLGNNEHGKFSVTLKNSSNHPIDIYFAPITGGTHSRQVIQTNQTVALKVAANTAIVIENNSVEPASVDLKVNGDTGLSMTYKN